MEESIAAGECTRSRLNYATAFQEIRAPPRSLYAPGNASILWRVSLPADHEQRLTRARLTLEGLAIGDAFGEMLAYNCAAARSRVDRGLMAGPWFHTDDTEMALSIYTVLERFGHMDRDALAAAFAERFRRDPDRGYGSMARAILRQILAGNNWRKASAGAFSGLGSMGNGGAMRVAPLGAYFADEPDDMILEQGAFSAEVTHMHPEGKAGAIAIALAAAAAWRSRDMSAEEAAGELLRTVHEGTPDGETRIGLTRALKLPFSTSAPTAARLLGNGSAVTAPDTVPFCIWSAAKHLASFREVLIETVIADGDCDTNCAIVGGIVALRTGHEGIPQEWRDARERFDFDLH
jgi:ADP-ribosylglycohydrolase